MMYSVEYYPSASESSSIPCDAMEYSDNTSESAKQIPLPLESNTLTTFYDAYKI